MGKADQRDEPPRLEGEGERRQEVAYKGQIVGDTRLVPRP